tara:strand:- start:85811 stop:86422 length:612 start_codon:yes stop_codon:yes gene_type:complete
MQNSLYSVEYSVVSTLFDEDIKFLTEINGKVITYDENDNQEVVGKVRFYSVDVCNAARSGWDIFSLLDTRGETSPFIELFESDTSELTEQVVDVLDEAISEFESQLFIVDRIEVLPKYRGEGLCGNLINEAIRLFGRGSDITALKCFPLQFENVVNENDEWRDAMGYKGLTQDSGSAASRLAQYYTALGFIPVPDSEVMVRVS